MRIRMELENKEAIKQAVIVQFEVAILSRHTIAREEATRDLVVLDVEYFPIVRSWYAVNRTAKSFSLAASASKRYLLGHASEGTKITTCVCRVDTDLRGAKIAVRRSVFQKATPLGRPER